MNILYAAADPEDNISVDLPDDLYWSDEFSWSPVEQTQDRLLQGALIIEESIKIAGRPITLEGAADMAWVTRETVLRLITLRDMPGSSFTLTFKDSREFVVKFDNSTTAVDAKPTMSWRQSDDADNYTITLRFLEI